MSKRAVTWRLPEELVVAIQAAAGDVPVTRWVQRVLEQAVGTDRPEDPEVRRRSMIEVARQRGRQDIVDDLEKVEYEPRHVGRPSGAYELVFSEESFKDLKSPGEFEEEEALAPPKIAPRHWAS